MPLWRVLFVLPLSTVFCRSCNVRLLPNRAFLVLSGLLGGWVVGLPALLLRESWLQTGEAAWLVGASVLGFLGMAALG